MSELIKAQQLWFSDIHQVEVRETILPSPAVEQVLVQVEYSAISAGTEMLVYRGQIPADMPLDASFDLQQHQPAYPLQYGYACVGRVIQVGAINSAENKTNNKTEAANKTKENSADWLGKRVFAFQPHASHFIAHVNDLIILPDDISAEAAIFLANMETAVNLIQDGNPGLGENVVVLGQGVVGLLLSSVLLQFPLAQLSVVEGIAARRNLAQQLGVNNVVDPAAEAEINTLKQQLANSEKARGADLIYEVSGVPAALNLAIDFSGFNSRIVIGSWYGNKSAAIALGGDAHRNRLQITTSQVSSIAPQLSGRWDKQRRFELAWQMIRQLNPQQLISHRVALVDAPQLYQQLHTAPEAIVQAVFVY